MGLPEFGVEVADDCAWIAHGDLDVGLELHPGTIECGVAFLKNSAHGMKGNALTLLNDRENVVENETVVVSTQPVEITQASTLIVGQRDALRGKLVLQVVRSAGEHLHELDVEEVKAIAELDYRAEHGGFFDLGAFALRLLNGPFQSTSGAVLPKVNAHAKPVIGVETGSELLSSREHLITQAAITAVEGENGTLITLEIHEVIVIG